MTETVAPRKKKRQPSYTATDRARALVLLDANNGSITRTAAETGISKRTLQLWSDRRKDQRVQLSSAAKAEIEEVRPLVTATVRELFQTAQRAALTNSIQKMDLLDAYRSGLVACAFTDKLLLLDGKPNHITARSGDVLHGLSADGVALLALLADRSAARPTVDVTPISASAVPTTASAVDPPPALPPHTPAQPTACPPPTTSPAGE